MHKVRLTGNNYQLVAENGGQTAQVLMSNYNEALEDEKRELSQLVEKNFYHLDGSDTVPDLVTAQDLPALLKKIKQDPVLYHQLLQLASADACNKT